MTRDEMIARYNHAIELINEKQQFRNGADELEALAQETKNVTVVLFAQTSPSFSHTPHPYTPPFRFSFS